MSVPDGVEVTRMRWWHVEEAAELDARVFDTPWSADQFMAELAEVPATRHYLVVLDGPRVIGYAGLRAVPPEADVQTLAVTLERQGVGLGSLLLELLLAEARHRGCTEVFLEVRADDERTVGLYRSRGFVTTHVRTRYYGDRDALAMRADLCAAAPPRGAR